MPKSLRRSPRSLEDLEVVKYIAKRPKKVTKVSYNLVTSNFYLILLIYHFILYYITIYTIPFRDQYIEPY